MDKALAKYIERKDREFTTEGGIRERMTAARLNQRETQRQIIERQAAEIEALRKEIARLKEIINRGGYLDNPDIPDIPKFPEYPDFPEKTLSVL